jgi:hypothetical protein
MASSDDGQDNEPNAWNTGVTFGCMVEAGMSILVGMNGTKGIRNTAMHCRWRLEFINAQ